MKHILVIDDSSDVRSLFGDVLTKAGYQVTCVPDGLDGLLLLKGQLFDLIVTDLIMPETEGIETICAIRKTDKRVPIIAMSGGGKVGPETYLGLATQLGATFAFEKPLDPRILLLAVRKCLVEHAPREQRSGVKLAEALA